jgi:hypothetical protein
VCNVLMKEGRHTPNFFVEIASQRLLECRSISLYVTGSESDNEHVEASATRGTTALVY